MTDIIDEKEKNKSQFNDLLKDYFAKLPKAGDLVKGKVVSITNGVVRLDVGGILTGMIRGKELFAESHEYSSLKIGDEVEATVIEMENESGEMELSFRFAGHQRVWDRLAQLAHDGITVNAKVTQANRGGLMVQVDALAGFLPVSQLNPEHYPRIPGGDKNRIFDFLRQLIGKDFQVKVIDVNQKEEKLIVSEKAVWEFFSSL